MTDKQKATCCDSGAKNIEADRVAHFGLRWLIENRPSGAGFMITHCPWCGTKLPALDEPPPDKITRTVAGAHAMLTRALNIVGEDAPIYIYHHETLYGVRIDIQPRGSLGPGSVLLTTVDE